MEGGPRGMIGITLKPETLKTWTFSLHICSLVANDISNMTSNEKATLIVHKKELNGQIRSVGVDCEKKLEATIDPLNPSSHPSSGIINVISGKITVTVNIDQALRIGEEDQEILKLLARRISKQYPKARTDVSSRKETHTSGICETII